MTNFDDDVEDLERVIEWLKKEYGYRIHLREFCLSCSSCGADACPQSSGILEVRSLALCSYIWTKLRRVNDFQLLSLDASSCAHPALRERLGAVQHGPDPGEPQVRCRLRQARVPGLGGQDCGKAGFAASDAGGGAFVLGCEGWAGADKEYRSAALQSGTIPILSAASRRRWRYCRCMEMEIWCENSLSLPCDADPFLADRSRRRSALPILSPLPMLTSPRRIFVPQDTLAAKSRNAHSQSDPRHVILPRFARPQG